jgi:hypothetical protein
MPESHFESSFQVAEKFKFEPHLAHSFDNIFTEKHSPAHAVSQEKPALAGNCGFVKF